MQIHALAIVYNGWQLQWLTWQKSSVFLKQDRTSTARFDFEEAQKQDDIKMYFAQVNNMQEIYFKPIEHSEI